MSGGALARQEQDRLDSGVAKEMFHPDCRYSIIQATVRAQIQSHMLACVMISICAFGRIFRLFLLSFLTIQSAVEGSVRELVNQGSLLWDEEHDDKRAEEIFQQAIALDPESTDALCSYGVLLDEARDDAHAAEGVRRPLLSAFFHFRCCKEQHLRCPTPSDARFVLLVPG